MTPNIDKIIEHYTHAREKHPYFCDKITRHDKDAIFAIGATIENRKWQIETFPNDGNGNLDVYPILSCRWFELLQAYLNGNSSVAIEKAYKCIAVLLRVIDVLEGRQKLGKPEEVKPKPDLPFEVADMVIGGCYIEVVRRTDTKEEVSSFPEDSKFHCDRLNAAALAWHERMKKEGK